MAGTLKVEVLKASGLLDRDSWGQGQSDPFVTVISPAGQEVLKTPTIDGKLNPVWHKGNSFEMKVTNNSGFIKFCVWDEDITSNDFLGEMSIGVADLCRTGNGDATKPLQPRKGEPDKIIRENAAKLGSLSIRWSFTPSQPTPSASPATPSPAQPRSAAPVQPPAAQPAQPFAGNQPAAQQPPPLPTKPVPQQAGVPQAVAPKPRLPPKLPGNLKITVNNGTDLLNREMMGTSDPFVKVLYGQELLLQTIKQDGTLNPVYPPKKSMALLAVDEAKLSTELVFEVWDDNTVSDDFMGEVRVLLKDVVYDEKREFPLKPRVGEKESKVLKNANKLGSLTVTFEYEQTTLKERVVVAAAPVEAMPKPLQQIPRRNTPGMLTFTVVRAGGLFNREFTGTSDPYCVLVGPNGRELIRTPEVKSTLTPHFPQEKSQVLHRLTSPDGDFTLQIHDKNTMSDDFMGEAKISVTRILSTVDGQLGVLLQPRADERDKDTLKNSGKLGFVVIECKYVEEQLATSASAVYEKEDVQLPGTLVAQVVSGAKLFNREMLGTSDPYVVVKGPKGEDQLKTPAAKSTINPRWSPETAKATMRIKEETGNIKFMVFDSNTVTDEFMGEATISVADALRAKGESILKLEPRETEPDGDVLKNAGKLGVLTVNFSYIAGAGDMAPPSVARDGKAQATIPPPDESRPKIIQPGRMTIKVKECKGLPKMDTFSGSADPYVKVLQGKSVAFRTKEVGNTLNPKWTGNDGAGEFFVSNIKEEVQLVVYDADATSDEMIGKTSFIPASVQRSGEATLSLKDEKGNVDNKLGTITFEWIHVPEDLSRALDLKTATASTIKDYIDCSGNLTLNIEGASSLLSRATFSDTPHFSLSSGGKELFKTVEKKGLTFSFAPSEATYEHFVINPNEALVLQARDGGDFQGEVTLDLRSMVRSGKDTLSLRPRTQEADEKILANRSRLGTVTISWMFEPQEVNANTITESGSLAMQLVQAKGLMSRDAMGEMEVFVKVSSKTSPELFKTKPKKYANTVATLDWQQAEGTMNIDIRDPNIPINFELFDEDMTSDDFLGVATFQPTKFGRTGEAVIALCPRKNETDDAVKKAKSLGSLVLRWQFEETKERHDVLSKTQAKREVAREERQKVVRAVRPKPPPRISIELISVSNVAFRMQRDDPEVVACLTHQDNVLHNQQSIAMSNDPATFPTVLSASFTPEQGDEISLRLYDGDEVDGLPLGMVAIPYMDPTAQRAESFKLQLLNAYGQSAGDAMLRVQVSDRTPQGDVRLEIREAKSLVVSAREIYCTATVGDESFTSKKALAAPEVFFGAPVKVAVKSAHETMTLRLHDAATNAVLGEGLITLGREGKTWCTLLKAATATTPQVNVGVVYVAWKLNLPEATPLAKCLSHNLSEPFGLVEFLVSRNLPIDEDMIPTVIIYNDKKEIVGKAEAIEGGNCSLFSQLVYLRTPRMPMTYTLEVQDPQKNSLCDGRFIIGLQEKQEWVELTPAQKTNHQVGGRLLIRTVGTPGGSAATTANEQKTELIVRLKGSQVVVQQPTFLTVGLEQLQDDLQESAPIAAPGSRLDQNFYLIPPVAAATKPKKQHTLVANLLAAGNRQVLASITQNVPRNRRTGQFTLNFGDAGSVEAAWLWIDGPMSTDICDNPDIFSIAPQQIRDVRLPRTKQYEAMLIEMTGGPTIRRTPMSANPSVGSAAWTAQNFDFCFDHEAMKGTKLKLKLIGIVQGREEEVGSCTVNAARQKPGREWMPIGTKSSGSVPTGEILVECGLTKSIRVDPEDQKVSKKALPAPRSVEGTKTQVIGPIGRPFTTNMDEREALGVLAPFLEKHFGVAREEQELSHRGKVLDASATLLENGLTPGADGVVQIMMGCLNKKTIVLQVKLPSGRTVPLAVTDKTMVWRAKAMLCDREDIDGIEEPGAVRFMANFNELQDDAAIGFYKLKMGATIVAVPKPKHATKKMPKKPASRLKINVTDVNGASSIVQLDANEKIGAVRSVVDVDVAGSKLYLDGTLVTNENKTLGSLGATMASAIQIQRSEPSPRKTSAQQRSFLSFDVEEPDGNVLRVQAQANEPIESVRRQLNALYPRHVIFYNGRRVKNESRTFAELEIMNGGFLQLRELGEQPQGDKNWARQRRHDEMSATIDDLQRQLEATRNAQQSERSMLLRISQLEKELEHSKRAHEESLLRIDELEDSLRRSHSLLRRTADASRTMQLASTFYSDAHRSPPSTPQRFGNMSQANLSGMY